MCAVAAEMGNASSRTSEPAARTTASKRGSMVTWLASVMQMRKLRYADFGSNPRVSLASPRSSASASRAGPISASARGVGRMPVDVRTKSGSCHSRRSLASQMLAVGWLSSSRAAARVMLCVR